MGPVLAVATSKLFYIMYFFNWIIWLDCALIPLAIVKASKGK